MCGTRFFNCQPNDILVSYNTTSPANQSLVFDPTKSCEEPVFVPDKITFCYMYGTVY